MTNVLTIKRLKEKVSEQMATQRDAGGAGFVISRINGMVLNANTGIFEFDLWNALEVPEGTNPALFGGNYCLSKAKARTEIIKGLGKQAVIYDKTINSLM